MTCPKWMRATLQTKHLINQIGFWERERQIEKRDYCEGHLPLFFFFFFFPPPSCLPLPLFLKGQTHLCNRQLSCPYDTHWKLLLHERHMFDIQGRVSGLGWCWTPVSHTSFTLPVFICFFKSSLMSRFKPKLNLRWSSGCFKQEVILFLWASSRGRINLLVAVVDSGRMLSP